MKFLFLSIIPVLHTIGTLLALHAIWWARTSDGAIAWALSLVSFPYLAIPAYLIFGADRFHHYTQALRAGSLEWIHPNVKKFFAEFWDEKWHPTPDKQALVDVLEKLGRVPFTQNDVELLIDGEETFARIHAEIAKAKNYILVLYFIVNDDETGNKLKDALIAKAREGVRVFFVYDELGSPKLEKGFAQAMREVGIQVHPFYTTRGWQNRFQLNFRNHRKIVIVDGDVALVGGLNVGDEELGKSKWYGYWRDTHVVVRGPAVLGVQMVFSEDYHWATGGQWVGDLDWEPNKPKRGDSAALYLSTGPADAIEVGVLFYLQCITSAKNRLWIASPYFVPDSAILEALKLAALRGVDVRIMLPPPRYEMHMALAASAFLGELDQTGIKVYRYPHYNHSKVMLVDDNLAWVGSSNLDSRSLRLNFEGNLVVLGQKFASQVHKMLERDFLQSQQITVEEARKLGWFSELGAKIMRLFSPIL